MSGNFQLSGGNVDLLLLPEPQRWLSVKLDFQFSLDLERYNSAMQYNPSSPEIQIQRSTLMLE